MVLLVITIYIISEQCARTKSIQIIIVVRLAKLAIANFGVLYLLKKKNTILTSHLVYFNNYYVMKNVKLFFNVMLNFNKKSSTVHKILKT